MAGGSTAIMDSDSEGVAGCRRTNHHPADRASATPNAVMPAITGKRRRREGAAAKRGGAAVKLSANSAAEAYRSAGTLASDLSTAAAIHSGTVSRMTRSGVGRAVISRATMACALSPTNGGSPASISYTTAPSE